MQRVTGMGFDPETLTYTADGLIPCIAQEEATGEVLMMAWMNAAAVARTLETKRVTYWSRSRQAFWVKGESSGHVQELAELRVDCDSDCLLALVRQTGLPHQPAQLLLHGGARWRGGGNHGADGLTVRRARRNGAALSRPLRCRCHHAYVTFMSGGLLD